MKPFYRTVRGLFKLLFFICHRHKVYGTDNLPNGPALIAANHTSFWDPPLITASTPCELHFLAKASLFRPPLGPIIERLNAHPVTGTASDLSSFKLIQQLILKGCKVVIFPEGSRSQTGEILPFKAGIGMLAMRTGAPIVPTYIQGLHEVWPMDQKFPKFWGKTAIIFGKPIHWQDYSHLEKKEAQQAIADAVHDAICSLKNSL